MRETSSPLPPTRRRRTDPSLSGASGGPATVAPRVVARSRRAGDRAGAHGVPAHLLVRPSPHRLGGVLRQRSRRRLHGGEPARHRGGGARLLRPRHRPPRRGVVPRPAQPRGARRPRLPARVAGHHRHDPDRRARGAVQAPDRDGGPQPVADRDDDGRVRRAAGAGRVLRAAEDRAAAAEGVRRRDPRVRAGVRADPRGVAIRRDDHRRALPRPGAHGGGALLLPAGHPGRGRGGHLHDPRHRARAASPPSRWSWRR